MQYTIIRKCKRALMKGEQPMKNEITVNCKCEAEVREGIGHLKAAGFKRTENCYWVEKWETEKTIYWVVRDF